MNKISVLLLLAVCTFVLGVTRAENTKDTRMGSTSLMDARESGPIFVQTHDKKPKNSGRGRYSGYGGGIGRSRSENQSELNNGVSNVALKSTRDRASGSGPISMVLNKIRRTSDPLAA